MEFQAGQNPFLMDDTDYGAPAGGAASSNPFLTGGDDYDMPSMADNPFLSAMGGAEDGAAAYLASNGASTNPFAAFAAPEPAPAAAPAPAWDAYGYQAQPAAIPPSTLHLQDNAMPAQPGVDYCAETSDIFGGQARAQPPSQPTSGRSSPMRPPPPRPMPPEETKNLILSVTGTMEATSHHLLDRLPPTRTPSPTLMRDTPSPTEQHYADFLGVGGAGVAPDTSHEVNLLGDLDDLTMPPPMIATQPIAVPLTSSDIMDMFDAGAPAPAAAPVSIFGVPPSEPVASEPAPAAPAPEVQPAAPVAAQVPPVVVQAAAVAAQPAPVVAQPAPVVAQPAPVAAQPAAVTSPPMTTPVAAPPVSTPAKVPPARPPPARPPPRPAPPAKVPSPVVTPTAPPPAPARATPDTAAPPLPPAPEVPARTPSATTTPTRPELPPPPTFTPAPAPEPVPQHDQSDLFGVPTANGGPKKTAEIMNLFGSDTAAVNALNSAPSAQPANDYFGGGGGFGGEQRAAPAPVAAPAPASAFGASNDNDFDAFSAKFESASATTITSDPFADPFGGSGGGGGGGADAFGGGGDAFGGSDAWGASATQTSGGGGGGGGFGGEDGFDEFLSLQAPPPVPQSTPARVSRAGSADSDDAPDFSVVIKPQSEFGTGFDASDGFVPQLAPPPPRQQQAAFVDTTPRFNPFDFRGDSGAPVQQEPQRPVLAGTPPGDFKRTDSAETPPTPLFDEDTSYPLEDFPRIHYDGPGWEMQLRQPNRKKITGQRYWKKIFIKLLYQGDNPVLQLFNTPTDKDPFQELPLQPCYCVSDISAQQFDQYGKIFTVKLQYVFYKERPGVRPGQVTKAERITNKLSQFAAYAIQGDYQGCKEFASDLKKLGMPVEHAPQISQLFKIGSQTYEDMKQFSIAVEEALFKLQSHRDRALNYKQEEVQITAVDELYVEQDKVGHVERQIARVRLFFLGFLSGMPDIELGVNEISRQGKEVVGRHDIIPVVTEEWIRLESIEFTSCVQQDEWDKNKIIKFKPPDACYIELMRFRVRPPRNRELPLQLKTTMCVTGNKVELRANVLVPGFSSRKYGQIPCEDISIRFPIPECWIYLFRVEKHFRYGSVKSTHRRAGKVKGIERFLGTVDTMEPSLLEVTSGQAKYEHQHRSIVWRVARLPKEGQGAYTTHTLTCRMSLTSFDQIPPDLEQIAKYAYVEFTMPQTQVSHTTVRSVSIQPQPDEPPEKYVRQLSRHEYRVEVEFTQGEGPAAYIAATMVKPAPAAPAPAPAAVPAPVAEESDSDSD
ncbi:protein stoned-B [Frankliniella occidentalis]|uniref:Protein stoned-B n=1 Tax=Frankliniella occidentalis TaxID=133901 RepID=A0A9C6X3N4_FRAOC|nr:protein stoned-B [Frankliniella occidentalis]